MHSDNPTYVQSCITTVSFPDTIDDVLNMVDKNDYLGPWLTDLDTLLEYSDREESGWTAARWLTVGDVLFFYHSKRARSRTKQLYKEAKNDVDSETELIELLKRSISLAEKHGGTMFGCARVIGPTFHSDDTELLHFDSRNFAPYADFCLFPHPLPIEEFRQFRPIGQNTVTPLYGNEFAGIKSLLAEKNDLPSYLRDALPNNKGFQTIDSDNWRSVACSPEARFRDETQIRTYFLDYLLSELKDRNSPLLEECECYRDGHTTGVADYFIRVGGHWIPIEAKLNVQTVPNILGQTTKYVNVEAIKTTKGANKDKSQQIERIRLCLVADQGGIYVVRNDQFYECSVNTPFLTRVQLADISIDGLRSQLVKLAEEPLT